MATFSVNVPDELMPRLIEAICAQGGFSPPEGRAVTPADKLRFAKQFIRNSILYQALANHETAVAARQAAEAKRRELEAELDPNAEV
jgi:hypothetical protein